ncbi:hypothetical protein AJ80_10035 [Polytolypa hystricis UAMH7299]|uniref:Uncharacterized protein n=1 Tax=Polytolypa hystricis (strain UAMH7299) TaxID=1447883 RepID=A0A2B7WEK2_POLH7|nr:hypothetical protein AJ80_10035 [Polytolypa hystricis UAMH7299]
MEQRKDLIGRLGRSKLCDARTRYDLLCAPKTVRKRRSAEANLNANQPTEAPAIRLSQPSNIDEDSDTDSAVYMLPYFKQEQKRIRKEQQERGRWVNRAIKCCDCDRTSSTTNKCECEHIRCDACFRYSDKPDAGTGGFEPAEEVPDCDNDDIWQIVKKATHQNRNRKASEMKLREQKVAWSVS